MNTTNLNMTLPLERVFRAITQRILLRGELSLLVCLEGNDVRASVFEASSDGTIANGSGPNLCGALAALLASIREHQQRDSEWPGPALRPAASQPEDAHRECPDCGGDPNVECDTCGRSGFVGGRDETSWTDTTRLRFSGSVWLPVCEPDETGVIVVSEGGDETLFIARDMFGAVEVLGEAPSSPRTDALPEQLAIRAQVCEVGGPLDDEQLVPVLLRCTIEDASKLGALLYQRVEVRKATETSDGV